MKNYRSLKKFLDWAWGSKKGFTLAEVMVAAGLIGVLSLALVNIMSNISKSSKKVQQDAEIIQLRLLVTRALNKESACTRTLGWYDANNNGTIAADEGNDITLASTGDHTDNDPVWGVELANGIYNNADPGAQPFIQANTNIGYGAGSLRVMRVGIRGFQNPAAPADLGDFAVNNVAYYQGWTLAGTTRRTGRAVLEVHVQRGGNTRAEDVKAKTTFGNVNTYVRIPITVITDENSEIVSCVADSREYVKASCEALGGTLDEVSGRCVEIQPGSHSVPGSRARPAVLAGSANSSDVTLSDDYSPLVVRREDVENNVLKLDNDEIQAVITGNNAGQLRINEEGGEVEIGAPGSLTEVQGDFDAELGATIGSDPAGSTIRVGYAGDTVHINPTTANITGTTNISDTNNISGTTTFTAGTVTSNDATTMTLNSNTITVGNTNGDLLNLTGTIRNTTSRNNGRVHITDSVDVNGTGSRIYLQDVGSTTNLSGKMVPNVEWVIQEMAERIANTLAPAVGDVTSIITDVIANNTSNDTALNVVREYVCDAIRLNSIGGSNISNGGSGCNFNINHNNCSVSGNCSQVCIGTQCRTNWNVSVTQVNRTSCSYVNYIYSHQNINPSNSTAASQNYINYLCPANEMVNGLARRYTTGGSGVHYWRSFIYCCAPVLN